MKPWDIEFRYYSQIDRLKRFLVAAVNQFSVFFAISLVLALVYDFGFLNNSNQLIFTLQLYRFGLLYFFVSYSIGLIRVAYLPKVDQFHLITSLLKTLIVLLALIGQYFWQEGADHSLVVKLISSQLFLGFTIIILFFIEFGRTTISLLARRLNPALLFIGSFTILILIGTGLLLLPNSTTQGISFIDALFTSTSAVCVTGLIVVDTATAFTPVGKTIIIMLIQLGGLGVMTFTTFFGLFYRRENSFQTQLLLKEVLNIDNVSGLFRTLLKILVVTVAIELIGALFIFYSIANVVPIGGFADKVAFSLFHSVSAFCNAGFSTLTDNLYATYIRHNYNLHFWIMVLIVLGGLGFSIIFNYFTLIRHFVWNKVNQLVGKQQRYIHTPRIINMNARIVVFTTAGLILFGAILFFIFERNNTLAGEGMLGQITGSFFGSITPRTAGFNTIDVTKMLPSTILITIFLMWVGASPGSTGGGIKTTTFALAILNIFNLATGRKYFVVGRREIPYNSVQRAFSVVFLSVITISLGSFLLVVFHPNLSFLSILFECTSAFSTVGLSVGITSQLAIPAKVVLIFLMLIGRVGLLSLVFSFLHHDSNSYGYRLPQESVYIN